MTLQDLVAAYIAEREPSGMFVAQPETMAAAVRATKFYLGWQDLADPDTTTLAEVRAATVLTQGEWAIIGPLFRLYVEADVARLMEASRTAGVELIGRSSSEVAGDIAQMERDLPQLAFMELPISVGLPPVVVNP
jgi:hypothetical protein